MPLRTSVTSIRLSSVFTPCWVVFATDWFTNNSTTAFEPLIDSTADFSTLADAVALYCTSTFERLSLDLMKLRRNDGVDSASTRPKFAV